MDLGIPAIRFVLDRYLFPFVRPRTAITTEISGTTQFDIQYQFAHPRSVLELFLPTTCLSFFADFGFRTCLRVALVADKEYQDVSALTWLNVSTVVSSFEQLSHLPLQLSVTRSCTR